MFVFMHRILKNIYEKNIKTKEALKKVEREYRNARLRINKKYDREILFKNIKMKDIDKRLGKYTL